MYTQPVIWGFIWSFRYLMKVAWGKESSQKTLHFSCSCSSDDAYRAFLEVPLQPGAAMALGEPPAAHRPARHGADGSAAPRARGVLASSFFSPGRREAPVIPLQWSPSISPMGWVPPTWGWMALICFRRLTILGEDVPEGVRVLLVAPRRAVPLKARDCSGFLLLSSMLWVSVKSFW